MRMLVFLSLHLRFFAIRACATSTQKPCSHAAAVLLSCASCISFLFGIVYKHLRALTFLLPFSLLVRYVGWKQLFPPELRDCGPMKSQFEHALKLMNEHVANPNRPVVFKVKTHTLSFSFFFTYHCTQFGCAGRGVDSTSQSRMASAIHCNNLLRI